MRLAWTEHAEVELAPGFEAGSPAPLKDVRIAIEGGFVHIAIAGSESTLVYSAPAIRRITYPTSARSCVT